MHAVPGLPAEWWERLGSAVRSRLAGWKRTTQVLRLTTVGCAVIVVIACIIEPGFREAMRVWLPCSLMLLAWATILPTRTLRWPSLARLFAVTTVWAAVVARLAARWSHV